GKMLKGDTGKFLSALRHYGGELLNVALAQADPEVAAILKEFPKVVSTIGRHGFMLAVEVKSANPPRIELVLVFPHSGGVKGALLALIDKIAGKGDGEVKETKVGGRIIHQVGNEMVHFGWWNEPDDDVVLVLGTTDPADLAKGIDAGTASF